MVISPASLRSCVGPALARNGARRYKSHKVLTEETMSQALRHMEYAVRGEVVTAASRLEEEILANPLSHPKIDHVLYTNVGNPHSVGQQSLRWPRQVMALCNMPDEFGIDHPEAHRIFPEDVIERAKEIKHMSLHDQGTGSYSHSQGHLHFRQHIAKFLEARDGGVPSNPHHIFMTNGASTGIDMILQTLLADDTCGIMIPIPQYPLYSATIALKKAHQVEYFLDEANGWSMDMGHIEECLANARAKGIHVNGFVLINPGNPTGQVLSRKAMHDVVKFCASHDLVLLSDEVYQDNVYEGEFISAKRAAFETGLLEQDAIELVSFHSSSKGLYGECGHRGGFMEVVGMDQHVESHLYKLASAALCPNLDGQIMVDLMVRGPSEGSQSYETYHQQRTEIFNSLKRKAAFMANGLNDIPGFSCQPAQGSMYCFPSIELPPKAIEDAELKKMDPDTFYALSLLESTGICVVPASGFGQRAGRHGFRTTFLPSEHEMSRAIELIRRHHEDFLARYET